VLGAVVVRGGVVGGDDCAFDGAAAIDSASSADAMKNVGQVTGRSGVNRSTRSMTDYRCGYGGWYAWRPMQCVCPL